MNQTRLNIVHTESSCGWGGQEVRILTESQGLIERGHQVQLVCCPESIIAERAGAYGVPVTTLPIQKRNFRGLSSARMWLANQSVDIVNTHSSTDSWLFTLAARSFRQRPRIIRTRHIGAPVKSNAGSNWIYSKGADYLVTCGENMREALISNNGVNPERSTSVPTGIDLNQFQPGDRTQARKEIGLPLDRKLIGIVAALRREKGHQYLCEAIRLLQRDDVDLLIVGDGLSHDLVRSWVAENGLTERTHLVGHQSHVVPYLHAMDLFVLPSWAIEGVPQSIMQAMSCQIPVISTTVGSIPQAVTANQSGRLVPARDADQLSAAIQELLENETLRIQFAQAGREKAVAEFGLSVMLDKMEAVFQQVLQTTPHSSQHAA